MNIERSIASPEKRHLTAKPPQKGRLNSVLTKIEPETAGGTMGEPKKVVVPTAQDIAMILGMKLPPELARMIQDDRQEPEPLPDGIGQGWKRQGLLHLPS
jgi:hypothetical protein